MNIEIKKLTPELAEDYVRFFDETPHNDEFKRKCYCITWCGDNIYHNDGKHWFDSPEERRFHAIERVRAGDIKGYFAYCDDKIVGWCNANTKADCKECITYLRSDGGVPLEECGAAEKVKFIFCFAIAPDYRRKGVASRLIEYICNDAKADDYNFVEVFTKREFVNDGFRGVFEMYEKQGFYAHAEQDGKIVMRKALT